MLYGQPAYQALPAQTSQQILRQVAGDWRSFFAACRTYQKDSGKLLGAPRPPHYKPAGGESIAFLTKQHCRIIDGWLYFPRAAGLIPVGGWHFNQRRRQRRL